MSSNGTSDTGGPGLVDYGLLFFLASLWGASFILIKTGVSVLPPATMTAARLVFAAGAMWFALALVRHRLPVDRRSWAFIVTVALLGTLLPFFLISWGQQAIPTGLTAILMGVMPLTTMVIAHIFIADDRLTLRKALGVLLGLVGLVVLVGPALLTTVGNDPLSQLAIMLAATCYGASAVVTRRMMVAGVSQIGLATGVMSVAAIAMAPIAFLVDGMPDALPIGWPLAAIACLGIVQTGFAQILLFKIVARQGPSFFSQINFLVPFLGVLWGYTVFGEELAVEAWVALVLIVGGLAVSRGQSRAASRTALSRS
ncbi:MAG: DMT family transporter [Pseudomonadota bacterium]